MKKHSRIEKYLAEVSSIISNHKECSFRNPENSIISIQFSDKHFHHCTPSDSKITKDIINDLISNSGISISDSETSSINPKEPVIFRNRQAIGDILMMTVSIRDFKASFPDWPINVQTTAMHLWDHNPHLDRSLNNSNAKVIEIGPGFLTNASNRDSRHFANAFRLSIEEKLGIKINQGLTKPDIWMTKEETSIPLIKPPYWIIVAGEKGDWTAKSYPFHRWIEVVKAFPDITFVQVGAKEHKHPDLNLPNVINMIGKTQDKENGIRDLFRLFYFAEGSMGLVSFQMHLAAAFNLPCVVVAGAREPVSFTRYPGHQYLATDGCLPCSTDKACWHCNLEKTCPSIIEEKGRRFPKCVDLITSNDIVRAIQQYYDGGRLSMDHPRVPILPNQIAKKISIPMIQKKEVKKNEENKDLDMHGYSWGGASITDQDWVFMKSILDKYSIQTILEFGPGLSSFLLFDEGKSVVTFETNPSWITSLKKKGLDKKVDLNFWNGTVLHGEKELPKFDLAIVDGPPGGESRETSTRIASEHADVILVHDAGRAGERKWQEKYLKDKFDGPGKGGHRFHLWIKKSSNLKINEPKISQSMVEGQKIFRIFCNSRGDGGCGRSIDYFMKAFVDLGWRVEYIHSNPQPSGTHRRCGSPKVVATDNLDLLRTPCDIFMIATDDYVWEFDKPNVVEMFSNINAKRKVMYVNFRIGKIGTIPWTREFDRYLFLNQSLADSFTVNYMTAVGMDQIFSIHPKVLPPPADISSFLNIEPNYSGPMQIIRHSSQGDSKYAKDFNDKVKAILEQFPEAIIRLMPCPSFIDDFGDRVICHRRNNPEVNEFLKLGNVYWYDLPENYSEGGPRVLLEAMAAGLPCIATNVAGPQDRIIKDVGFVYTDFEESLPMFERLNSSVIREKMGRAAKAHATEKFNPSQWIDEIVGK